MAERVEDDLRDRGVEVDARDEAVLVNDLLKLAVGKEQELLGSRIHLLSNVGLLGILSTLRSSLALIKDLGQLLNAISLLDLLHDAIVLLDQMVDDGLEQAHRLVLSHVSKVHQVVLELLGGIVGDTDVDQSSLKSQFLEC